MDNMELWERVKLPPKEACKIITGGRMNGKTDINPMWRIQQLTENFGICGIGWYDELIRVWTEDGTEGQKIAFAEIKLYIKVGSEWSKGISGVGGNMQITKEKSGFHNNDECYKMAITDALSVACKKLGFGAMIYSGMQDFETKYTKAETPIKNDDVNNKAKSEKALELRNLAKPVAKLLDKKVYERLAELAKDNGASLTSDEYQDIKIAIKTTIAEMKLDEATGGE